MYIDHIHYSNAAVFTVSYQKQEMDTYSHTHILDGMDDVLCVCNEQMMLKQTNSALN